MPQLLRIGPYSIYFWSNEGDPLEPIHVHISEGRAKSTATKIWITSTGNVILSNNNSQIPERILKKLMRGLTGLRLRPDSWLAPLLRAGGGNYI